MIFDRKSLLRMLDIRWALFGLACLAVSVALALDGQLRWAVLFLVLAATFLPGAIGVVVLLGVAVLWLVARVHQPDMHFIDWLLAYWPVGAAWLAAVTVYVALMHWWAGGERHLDDAASGGISPAERVDQAHRSQRKPESRGSAGSDRAPED